MEVATGIAQIAKHQGIAEAAVIAAAAPNHRQVIFGERVIAHQATLFSRRIKQRGDLRFGQFLSSCHVRPLADEAGNPADLGVDQGAALDAERTADGCFGRASIEGGDHRGEFLGVDGYWPAAAAPPRRRAAARPAFTRSRASERSNCAKTRTPLAGWWCLFARSRTGTRFRAL